MDNAFSCRGTGYTTMPVIYEIGDQDRRPASINGKTDDDEEQNTALAWILIAGNLNFSELINPRDRKCSFLIWKSSIHLIIRDYFLWCTFGV